MREFGIDGDGDGDAEGIVGLTEGMFFFLCI